jgi:hypothetical protein
MRSVVRDVGSGGFGGEAPPDSHATMAGAPDGKSTHQRQRGRQPKNLQKLWTAWTAATAGF